MTSEHRLSGRSGAAERHVQHLYPRSMLEQLCRDVRRGPLPGRGEAQSIRIFPGVLDQLFDRVDAQCRLRRKDAEQGIEERAVTDEQKAEIAEVRWTRLFNAESDMPPGMGLRFMELSPGSDTAIERFLKEREPLFYDDE